MKTKNLIEIKDRVKFAVLVRAAGLNQNTVLAALGMTGRKPRELNQTEARLLRIELRRLGRDIDKILMK